MAITHQKIKECDPQGMWDLIRNFPNQWKAIIDSTNNVDLNIKSSKINNICLAGMGGSAIGADIMRAYAYSSSPWPIHVVRHYDIPAWVDENTLFITCSFSGNTEETLSALDQAIDKGAQIVGVTSGGTLKEKAAQHNFDVIEIPGGMPPRAALGYSFVPLFRIFSSLNILEEDDSVLEETHAFLANKVEELCNIEGNRALEIAEKIHGTLAVIYSDHLLLEPVNLRWRGQIEENAKEIVYGNFFPEMNHNEIVGWQKSEHLKGKTSVIFLKDKEDNERVKIRQEIVKELIQNHTKSIIEISTEGESRLTRVFSLIQLADWVSIYLAFLNQLDPTEIKNIDYLKKRLSKV